MVPDSRLVLAVALVVLVGLAGCSAVFGGESDPAESAGDAMTVEIVAVEDGDTYWFENDTGHRVGIRLVGVDTPEIRGKNYPEEYEHIPNSDAGRQYLYEWGRKVRNETRDRLVGETVRLTFDPNLPRRDYYGRLVAYVYHDGTLLNEALLRQGYARVYPVTFAKQSAFERAEAAARDAGRGLWNYSEDG